MEHGEIFLVALISDCLGREHVLIRVHIEWSLQIMDTLGTSILSIVQRLSLLRR